jgi:CubicO group peptidase (beta-lactamase class C family)
MSQFKLLLLSCVLLSACTTTNNESLPSLPNSGTRIDQSRLERIDTAVNQAVVNGEISGAVALIIKGDQTVYHKAFGLADIATQKPMKNDSIFRIASMTKAITSTAIMILHEQGSLQLNDSVSKYLPEFSSMKVVDEVSEDGTIVSTKPATKPIRIVDLLMHASGITYGFIPGKLSKSYADAGVLDSLTVSNFDLASNIRRLAAQPLLFEPGSKWAYGLSTDVLGRVVEVVSGQALDQYFLEHITAPLKMDDTWFYLPDDKADRLVTLYAHVDDKGLVASNGSESDIKLDDSNYPIQGAKTYFSGGAGMSSTAADYGRFVHMLLNDGELDGVRIMSRKSVELMRTPRIDIDGDGTADFGLGFAVIADLGKYDTLGSVGSYAWGGAFFTSYWIDPSENLAAVLMSQARPVKSNLDNKFRTLVYQALE